MLYDYRGREIRDDDDKAARRALTDRLVQWEPQDRLHEDEGRSLTPQKLDQILLDANAGDPRAQARLSAEIEEKDWSVTSAIGVRAAAVKGLPFSFKPPKGLENDKLAKKISDAANENLLGSWGDDSADDDVVGLDGVIFHLIGNILPGYGCMEILWGPGGQTVEGYVPIGTDRITFTQSLNPLLYSSDNPSGAPLVSNKFVWHRHPARSGDPTRGGLIRPLGWMHLFEKYGVKNLMRFVEKFGMPFVAAKLQDHAWDKERGKVVSLIKNFGSDGGAVFSDAVELEFIQAANASGDIYFRLLEYFEAAKTKVILGQTATSGDAQGWSNGGAQSMVRQDILESDCAMICPTIRKSIVRPWVLWNYGEDAPVPVPSFDYEPPEDREQKSRILLNLKGAGLEVDDVDEASAHYGIKLRRTPQAPDRLAFRDSPSSPSAKEAEKAMLGSDMVAEEALQRAGEDEHAVMDMLAPVADAIDEALAGAEDDEADFLDRIGELLDAIPGLAERMDTRALEKHIAEAYRGGAVNGAVQAAGGAQ